MSASILSGDFTVYFTNDTGGDKQIKWTGSATGTRTLNELYGALQDLFDNVSGGAGSYMDEGIPMSAQTPTEYTIGLIESNDSEPWFIDTESVKHLTGGALQTKGWNRITTSNTGIVKFDYTVGAGTDFASGDIGKTVTHSVGGDSGTLLHYESNGTSGTAWVRPDSNAAANDWNSTGTNVSVTSGTGSNLNQSAAATSEQESIWSNIYSLGSIVDDTEIYVYQVGSALTQWWDTGHIDILVLTTDFGLTTNSGLIDDGLLTIYARQYGSLYDHFTVDVSSGGRTPIPLATSSDINNTTGYYTLNGSSGVSDFDVGNYIYVGASWSTATKKGVITDVSGTTTDPDIEYYLIGDLTNFATSDSLKEYDPATAADGDGSCTVDSVADAGPRTSPSTTLTIDANGVSRDLSNGNGSRPYSIELDLQNTITVAQLYQRLKYLTRRGQSTDIETETSQSLVGQAYTAIGDYYIPYDTGSVAIPFTEGDTVSSTDQSTFSGVITAVHDRGSNAGFIIVRTVRGTIPTDNQNLTDDNTSATALVDTNAGADPVKQINPFKSAPFGTFAGGKFFGARGIWLANVPAADATNYELIDSEGVRQVPPNTVPIEVSGVVQNTQCYVVDTTPTTYLNTTATTLVSGDQYKASTTLTYSTDIAVTIRTREMGYLPFETTGTISFSGLSVTAVFLTDPNFKMVITGESITFTNATSLITRSTGDFGTDGWLSIMSQVTVEGSTNNDGTYTITAVSTNTITVSATLTDETVSSGCTLTYTRREPTW